MTFQLCTQQDSNNYDHILEAEDYTSVISDDTMVSDLDPVNPVDKLNASEKAKKCGVWDSDVKVAVHSCSFWMEGVLLTTTGKYLQQPRGLGDPINPLACVSVF